MSGMLFLAVMVTFVVGASAVGFAVRDARFTRVHREAVRDWESTRRVQLGWDGWAWGLSRGEPPSPSVARAPAAGAQQVPRWGGEPG